jgi:hypothetical protein
MSVEIMNGTFDGAEIGGASMVYAVRAMEGEEIDFFFTAKDAFMRFELDRDVPLGIAGRELVLPKGSHATPGIFSDIWNVSNLTP